MAAQASDMSWIAKLVDENLLAILDVALDIEQALQLGSDVDIPLLQPRVRFRQLMPADGANLRDRYCELRWKAVHLLRDRGAIESVEIVRGAHRWEGRLELGVNRDAFDPVLTALREEYDRRIAASGKAKSLVVSPLEQPLERLRQLVLRFHSIVIQLRERHDNRGTLDVADEYDVQDLMHALLRLYFDDIRPEEWTPSYAGKSARVDFVMRPEEIVLEIKKTRPGLSEKEIGEQLIIDIERYSKMPWCKTLVCMVYDPENRIANPGGFQSDLSGQREKLLVEVIIVPKQY